MPRIRSANTQGAVSNVREEEKRREAAMTPGLSRGTPARVGLAQEDSEAGALGPIRSFYLENQRMVEIGGALIGGILLGSLLSG